MRILFLHDRLSAKGGADRYLIALLEKLRQNGHDTLLAVGRDDSSVSDGQLCALGPWQRLKGLQGRGLRQKGRAAARQRLAILLEDFQPQVIHLHNIMDPDLIALAASFGKALMTVQDHRLFCPGQGKVSPQGQACEALLGPACGNCLGGTRYGNRLLALTRSRLRAAAGLAGVHVLSGYMAAQLRETWQKLGMEPPPLHVVPPFVHRLARAKTPQPRRHHLLACRLVERKGVRTAMRAAEMLGHSIPLRIAGDGVLAPKIAERAQKSKGRVRYAGWCGRADMGRLLGGAVSLWLPSLWAEPFGIVGLEALWLKTPVIASRVGGVEDWLQDGVNGFLIPSGDPHELAAAADRLSKDPDLARRLGRKGHEMVRERFPPGAIMQKIVSIYMDIMRF